MTNNVLHNIIVSDDDSHSLLPSTKYAMDTIHSYIKDFAARARVDSEPAIQSIVYEIEKQQNVSREFFTYRLAKEMGGLDLKDTSKLLVQEFGKLFYAMKEIDHSEKGFKANGIEFDSQVDELKSYLESLCDLLKQNSHPYEAQCFHILDEFEDDKVKLNVNIASLFPIEAKTFINLMNKYQQDPEKMRLENEAVDARKKAFEDATYLEAKEILGVEKSIREMFTEQWNVLEVKMQEQAREFFEFSSSTINMLKPKIKSYEGIRYGVYIMLLLIIIFMALIYSYFFFRYFFGNRRNESKRFRTASRYGLISLYIFLSVVVLSLTFSFSIGAYTQSELCRYLTDTHVNNENGTSYYLDPVINSWVDNNWKNIEGKVKESFPMGIPKPQNILNGLHVSCKKNDSIFVAINALNSINASAVAKPDQVKVFMDRGLALLQKHVRIAKTSDWLRPNAMEELKDFKFIPTYFKDLSYTEYYTTLGSPLYLYNLSTIETLISTIDHSSNSIQLNPVYYTKIKSGVMESLQHLRSIPVILENFKLKAKIELQKAEKVPDLDPIIDKMIHYMTILQSYLDNKTNWMDLGTRLFNEIVYKEAETQAPILVTKIVTKVMSVLGPCRSLFDAASSLIRTSCVSVNESINALWLSMGMALLFLTILSLFMPYILQKEETREILFSSDILTYNSKKSRIFRIKTTDSDLQSLTGSEGKLLLNNS